MEHYAGLDVSLELTSVCIVDAQGRIIHETKVPSDPDDLVRYFGALEQPITRVALEAAPLSQWICAGLTAAGFETVLLETRHVKAALKAMSVKTDRRDARGIAQLLRFGWYAHADRAVLEPQAVGHGGCQAARHEEGARGAGTQARRHPPPHVGRWRQLPLVQ